MRGVNGSDLQSLLLKGLGVDPAVASGPLLTTVTDMASFFLVLSLATLFMQRLIAWSAHLLNGKV